MENNSIDFKTPKNRLLYFSSFIPLCAFYLSCGVIFFLIEHIFNTASIFSEQNFLNWDAAHYADIMQYGYRNENVAFFPLFPFLWNWLHVSATIISIANGFIFIASFAWLASVFEIKSRTLVLLASIPSLIFMFLPFSEAVFFLTSTVFLIGYKKDNLWMTTAGIFLACLSRPVFSVFIPALILTEFISYKKKQHEETDLKQSTVPSYLDFPFGRALILLFIIVAGTFLVFLLQYAQTGKWFTFFQAQKQWSNYLRMPAFPLSSWAGGFIVRLDAIAFFFGALALIVLIYILQNIITGRKKEENKLNIHHSSNSAFVFSISYLALLSLLMLFTKGGTLNSFNRYLFATPFFIIAMNEILKREIFTTRNMAMLLLGSTIFWMLFASYVHIQYFLKFEILSLYLGILLLSTSKIQKLKTVSYFILITTNIILLLTFYHRFLSNNWVG